MSTNDSSNAAVATPEEALRQKKQPKTFNFKRPNKFNRDHFRAFQIVHETFARQLSTVLSTTLRAVSSVSVSSIEEASYGEFVDGANNPSFMAIMQIAPLPGASLLHLPQELAMGIVERLLGGPGTGPFPDRPLTDIESILMRDLSDRALRELTYSYESLFEVHAKTMQLESNPQFAQIASPSDMTLLVTFDIRISDVDSQMKLCVPYASLQGQLEHLNASHAFRDDADINAADVRMAVEARLLNAPVNVNVLFNEVMMTGNEILALTVGDVVALGHPTDAPLTVKADDVPHLLAKPGRQGKRLACQVVDTINPHLYK